MGSSNCHCAAPQPFALCLTHEKMPGLHSPSKLAARRQRAIARGFVSPCNFGKRLIEVDAAVANRVKAVGRMIETHRRNNLACGQNFHYAANAAVAAREVHGNAQFLQDKKIIKLGNAAKHCWADMSDGDRFVESS